MTPYIIGAFALGLGWFLRDAKEIRRRRRILEQRGHIPFRG